MIDRRDSLSLQVSILGHTAINGVQLTRRQRPLVAALAFHMPRAVSIDNLIDCVWPDGPPTTARQSIHNQVARLREQFGEELIETVGVGYRLVARSDLANVEQIVRTWLPQTSTPAAVAPLSFALSLWQAAPYLDLCDRHEVLAEQSRLAQLRTQIVEMLAVSRMLAGDFATAADELMAYTATDPYDENAWSLLMVSLYFGNRRADALAAFDRVSLEFATSLGSAPSQALHELRKTITEGGPIPAAIWTDSCLPAEQQDPITAQSAPRRCMSCQQELRSESPYDRRLRVVPTGEAGFNRVQEMLAEQPVLATETLHSTAQ